MVLFRSERRSLFVVALLLGATFLLANLAFNLQNLALGPETLPVDPEIIRVDPPFPVQTGDIRPAILAITIVLAAAFVINLILLLLRKEMRGPFLIEMAGLLLALAVILAIFFLLDLFAGLSFYTPGGTGFGGTPDGSQGPPPAVPVAPVGLGIVALVLFAIALVLLLSRRVGRRAESDLVAVAKRRALDRLQETIYRLEMGEEVRSTILRCYTDMTQLFRQRGLAYGRDVTARELEELAEERLGVSNRSSVRLRELFEEARYSAHSLEEGYKRTALRCLNTVKGELEAAPVA